MFTPRVPFSLDNPALGLLRINLVCDFGSPVESDPAISFLETLMCYPFPLVEHPLSRHRHR